MVGRFQIKSAAGFYWTSAGYTNKKNAFTFDYFQDAVWVASLINRKKYCGKCNCKDCVLESKNVNHADAKIVPEDEIFPLEVSYDPFSEKDANHPLQSVF